jgi:CHAD domain-containing protein
MGRNKLRYLTEYPRVVADLSRITVFRMESQAHQDRHLTTARRAIADLRTGHTKPETLHRLRTHLRRLQAYLELIGESAAAQELGRCVSRSSRLRTLEVFEQYMAKVGATRHDRRQVKKRIRQRQSKLARHGTYEVIDQTLQGVSPQAGFQAEWLAYRLETLRREHTESLRRLQVKLQKRPGRKRLHQLRLLLKTIRYQEEAVLGGPFGRPRLVQRLKRLQGVLGAYEDYAQFRKWGRAWKLSIRPRIRKDWRVARRQARGIGQNLESVIAAVQSPRLRLVPHRVPPISHQRSLPR